MEAATCRNIENTLAVDTWNAWEHDAVHTHNIHPITY
jgi:hypothetical protein